LSKEGIHRGLKDIRKQNFPIALLTLDKFTCKGKGKAIPVKTWTGPEGSRRLRPTDFKTIDTRRW
jgi:hypothetical protein